MAEFGAGAEAPAGLAASRLAEADFSSGAEITRRYAEHGFERPRGVRRVGEAALGCEARDRQIRQGAEQSSKLLDSEMTEVPFKRGLAIGEDPMEGPL